MKFLLINTLVLLLWAGCIYLLFISALPDMAAQWVSYQLQQMLH